MTGRERLHCALNHQEPDMVPVFECVYSRHIFQEQFGFIPKTFDPVSVIELSHKMGYDFAFIPIPGVAGFPPEEEVDTIYVDEWGITRKSDPNTWPIDAGIKSPLESAEDWVSYKMPDPEAEFRYTGLAECLRRAEAYGMGVIGNMRGPFSAAWQLFGMEEFLCMFYTDPDVVHEALTACTDFAIACSRRMAKMGVDALIYSDDYGSTQAPLFSPETFREFMAPQLKRIKAVADELGLKMILHSDGNIAKLIPEIIACGIDGLHPIQRCADMEIGDVKTRYGDKLTLFGNIDNVGVLVSGTEDDIDAMVKDCIHKAAPGGGYCLGSDHSVHDDIPNRNVYAMRDAARKYGHYPIEV